MNGDPFSFIWVPFSHCHERIIPLLKAFDSLLYVECRIVSRFESVFAIALALQGIVIRA